MFSIELTVTGVVQGVGFRYYTQAEANKLGIKGYVKNEYDGSVSIVATGEDNALRKFIAWAKIGPRSAVVSNVDIKHLDEVLKFNNFGVRY